MNALIREEGNLLLNPDSNRKSTQRQKNWHDMLISTHSHEAPCGTIQYILKILDAFARDTN